jgi:hypothetical protein
VSLEIEARFTSPKGQLLMIAWFEGSSAARLVLTGPAGEREEVQINRIEASLESDVVAVLQESVPPGPVDSASLTAKLQVNTDRQRVGRAVRLGGGQSQADQLCAKLVAMASLLARDHALIRTLEVVKQHLG